MLDLRSAWMAWVLLLWLWLTLAQGMKDNQIKELRYFILILLIRHSRLFLLRAGELELT